jgi:hypothetical protein
VAARDDEVVVVEVGVDGSELYGRVPDFGREQRVPGGWWRAATRSTISSLVLGRS